MCPAFELKKKVLFQMFRIVFWDVLPCKIIVDRRFRGAYCLHHQGSSQKTILNIILAAVRTWNLTYFSRVLPKEKIFLLVPSELSALHLGMLYLNIVLMVCVEVYSLCCSCLCKQMFQIYEEDFISRSSIPIYYRHI
jgi:hypothetical protein